MERATTCCFTGHRPDKLPWGEQEDDPRCVRAKQEIAQALERAYAAGCRHFMCGMAKGSDLYFAQAVLELRDRKPDVTLEGVRPCESQADSWREEEKKNDEYPHAYLLRPLCQPPHCPTAGGGDAGDGLLV